MKYLAEHECTLKFLPNCNSAKWLVIYFYFDFRAGSSTANSIDGLLKALMHQMVRQNQSISDFIHDDPVGEDLLTEETSVSHDDLIELIVRATHVADANICVFLDGLDEYSGSYMDLETLTQRLSNEADMLLCLASREEPELQLYLKSCPKLRMQDHNSITIREYVEEAIHGITQLSSDIEELVDYIVTYSEGVILWACFAAQELRESLFRVDPLELTYERLTTFPNDLENVYEGILARLVTTIRWKLL